MVFTSLSTGIVFFNYSRRVLLALGVAVLCVNVILYKILPLVCDGHVLTNGFC